MEPNTRPQLQFLDFDKIEDTGEAAYLQSLLYSVGSPRLLLPWSESAAPVQVHSTEWPAPSYEVSAAEMGAGEGDNAASVASREETGGEQIFHQVPMPVVTTMQQLYHAHPPMPPISYMHPSAYHPHFQQAHPMYSPTNPTVSAASVSSPAGSGRRIAVNNSGNGPPSGPGGNKHSPKRRPDQNISNNGGNSPQYPPSGAQPPFSPQLHHPAMAYQYTISPAGPPPTQAVIPNPQHAAGPPVYLAAGHLPMYSHMYSFAPVPPHPHQPPMYPPQQQAAPIVPQSVSSAPLNGGTVNVADEAPKVIDQVVGNFVVSPESGEKSHRHPPRQSPPPPTKPPQPHRVSPVVGQPAGGISKSLPPQTAIKTTAPPALPPVVKRNRTSESDTTQSPPPVVQQQPQPQQQVPTPPPPVEHVTPEPDNTDQAPQEIPPPPPTAVNVVPAPAPLAPPPAPAIKSWAAVLKNTSGDSSGLVGSGDHHVQVVSRPPGVPGSGPPQSALALSTPSSSLKPPAPAASSPSISTSQQSNSSAPIDPTLKRLGAALTAYTLEHRAIILTPRGLTNPSNYCYINATLQALLACPPFYNLIRAIANVKDENKKPPLVPQKSRTPILDSMVRFINEFSQASQSRLLLVRKEKLQARKESPDGGATVDVVSGAPFEPTFIYQMLRKMKTEDSFHEEGRQEDAEEFLSFLLNGLNDEMIELQKLANETSNPIVNGDVTANGETHNDDEMWKEMTNKGGRITRRAELERTPLSDIFRGQLRSSVHRKQAESTDNVQPFFTLQLDTESSSSVEEALEKLVMVDPLEVPDSTGAVSTQQTLDQLPCVLILHLKCFHYRQQTPSKIMKALKFPVDLKLDQKLLSSKSKSAAKGRHFKLFAVVYHDGKEATKGHYLADVFHVGTGGWIRYDDGNVQPVSVEQVQSPKPPTVPYLLYYRRTDTIAHPRSV